MTRTWAFCISDRESSKFRTLRKNIVVEISCKQYYFCNMAYREYCGQCPNMDRGDDQFLRKTNQHLPERRILHVYCGKLQYAEYPVSNILCAIWRVKNIVDSVQTWIGGTVSSCGRLSSISQNKRPRMDSAHCELSRCAHTYVAE